MKDKLISMQSAKNFIEANWPNDPRLKQIALNLLGRLSTVTGEEVHSMFDALHKENKKIYHVYAVEGTMFLIYIEDKDDSRWEWRDMDEFIPAKPSVATANYR